MNRYFFSLLVVFLIQIANAQEVINYDKEKLLEFYQSQRYGDAAQYLSGVLPENTTDIKLLNQIAYCYMMSGNLQLAEKYYLKIGEQQPRSLPVLFNLANINSRRGNIGAARNYLMNVIQLDSLNFSGYKQLAGLINNPVDSIKIIYLSSANRINPAEAEVALDLAIALKAKKLYEPAYQILNKAIAADSGNLILKQAKLPIANQLKKYQEVVEIGESLLKEGSDANVVKDVGIAHFNLKHYEKAISFFNMLEEAKTQNETTLYYTSLCYRNLGKNNLAANYAKKTVEAGISPYIPSYYALLGGIYELDKLNDKAISAYSKGLSFGENASIFYRLGILYDSHKKQYKTAAKYYRLYLKSKPDAKLEKAELAYVNDRLNTLQKKN